MSASARNCKEIASQGSVWQERRDDRRVMRQRHVLMLEDIVFVVSCNIALHFLIANRKELAMADYYQGLDEGNSGGRGLVGVLNLMLFP